MDRKFRCKRPVSMYFTQLKMFRTSVAVFLYIPSSIAEKVFSFLTGIMLIVKLYKKIGFLAFSAPLNYAKSLRANILKPRIFPQI